MALPDNTLQQVATYQESSLAYMVNLNCFVTTSNTKFKDFEDRIANLGDTVTYDTPPRFITANSLIANFQGSTQQVRTLVVNEAQNVAYNFSAQEILFNVEDYMRIWGKSAVEELSANVEANVAQQCLTNTFRFYGDGVTPITTYNQLAKALAFFRNYGAAKNDTRGYLPDLIVPDIVGSGLAQFALDRGNEDAMSWELGPFARCEWYQSNLLPVHTAGTIGNDALVMTVVSVSTDPNGAINAITFNVAGDNNDASAILQYDKIQFSDNIAPYTNLRFLTYIGHQVSQSPVQLQATAQAATGAGGNVTISIYPPLVVGANTSATVGVANINAAIVPGMQATVLPNHRSGLINSGNPMFLGMPRLPDQDPFYTAAEYDPDTGVSMRMYWGTIFGQNQQGFVHDCIWGVDMFPHMAMAIVTPL